MKSMTETSTKTRNFTVRKADANENGEDSHCCTSRERMEPAMIEENNVLNDSFTLSEFNFLPETTRPTPSSRPSAWAAVTNAAARTTGNPTSPSINKVPIARSNNFLAIMKEQEEAAARERQESVEASRVAEMEQEEELIRLALERSLTDMNTSFSAPDPVSTTHTASITTTTTNTKDLSLRASSQSSTSELDGFARKVQQDVETTEGFVDSPHGHRKFLIRPSLSRPSVANNDDDDDDNLLQEARRHLSPEEVKQIERALGKESGEYSSIEEQYPPTAASKHNANKDDDKKSLPTSTLSDFGLEEASEHLSPEELEQITQALRETADSGTKTDATEHKQASQPLTPMISPEDSEAIARALKQADEEEERKSLELALQMLQEDDKERFLSGTARREQGNIRVMTRAELDAESSISQVASLPSVIPPIDVDASEENISAGFRMNANARQEWTRRDQHSIVGPNNEIRTKHDALLQGRANAHRLGLDTDHAEGKTLVGNKAYNAFVKSVRRTTNKGVAAHGTGRAGADTDATKGGAMDPSVRIVIAHAINNGLIDKCNGVVKEGKEAIIYHADKGSESNGFDVAIKVFKRIQEFKGRGDYVEGDPRYVNKAFKKVGQREQLALWTEKEYRNLVRANRAFVPTPTPLFFKENVLFMRFLGSEGWPAPQLRELELRHGSSRWTTLYKQVMDAMRRLYCDARLIHGDLSEYNILVAPSHLLDTREANDELQAVLIDFGQAVDIRHPDASTLLRRDVDRVLFFFRRAGVTVMSIAEALEYVEG